MSKALETARALVKMLEEQENTAKTGVELSALDLDVPVPEIYGEIRRKPDGTLYTTGAQRTGCSMCGFGIHLEKRPHRFDQLRERNPQEWEFWMYRCCTDPKNGREIRMGPCTGLYRSRLGGLAVCADDNL